MRRSASARSSSQPVIGAYCTISDPGGSPGTVTGVSRRKTERLMNLVIALLATRRGLSAEAIRERVPGYTDEDVAFKRMFERDKEELRDMGVPLETTTDWEGESVYRIARRDYELPEISLEPDEAAALGLAARVWRAASLGDAAARGRRKLAAGGAPVDTEEALPKGLEPRLEASEPAFEPALAAVRDRRPVSFDYRPGSGGGTASRRVEPWGLVWRRGRWYLVGHDLDRAAERIFRLSRISGPLRPAGPPGTVSVPEGANLKEMVAAIEEPRGSARLRVRKGRAIDLRREATATAEQDGEWDEITVAFPDVTRFAGRLAGYGPDVLILDPPELRDSLISHLRALV